MQRLKSSARIGAIFFAALANTTAVAETVQQCQDKAKELQSHGTCGQGDMACVVRLDNELKNSVGETCRRAIEDLKPKPLPPSPVPVTQ
ncbi:conserved exported hypothetical protein [Cupriavidus necator]|uniref:Uncharacterized protein n=1 Tax=Cupriavidus necator TaxID=106590 RepID=A0A1K0IRG3_CUPNE|nr:conserved exported hypothetical protein [Cupriavidus necator]